MLNWNLLRALFLPYFLRSLTRGSLVNKPSTLRTLLNAKYVRYENKPVECVSIGINSGFRCAALNKAVGGSSTSAHCKGYAVDLTVTIKFKDKTKKTLPYTTLYEDIMAWVKAGKLNADQVIQEKSGSHCWKSSKKRGTGWEIHRRGGWIRKYN